MVRIFAPTKIQIGGKTFDVVQRAGLVVAEGLEGSCNLNSLRIELESELSPVHKTNIFLHEWAEGFNNAYCANNLNHDDLLRLGHGLLQLLNGLGVEIEWN